MNITHSFGKRSIQMDEKIVMTRRDLDRLLIQERVETARAVGSYIKIMKLSGDEITQLVEDCIASLTKGKV